MSAVERQLAGAGALLGALRSLAWVAAAAAAMVMVPAAGADMMPSQPQHCWCRHPMELRPTAHAAGGGRVQAGPRVQHGLRHQAQLWRTNADLSRPKSACGAQGTLGRLNSSQQAPRPACRVP